MAINFLMTPNTMQCHAMNPPRQQPEEHDKKLHDLIRPQNPQIQI